MKKTVMPPTEIDGNHSTFDARHVVLRSLLPVAAGLGALYALLAATHFLVLPPTVARVLAPVAAGTSLALFGLAVLLQREVVPPRWAHAAAAGIPGLVAINGLLRLVLTAQQGQAVGLLLLIVGAGALLLSTAWLVSLVGAVIIGWIVVVVAHPSLPVGSASDALRFGTALVSAAALSALTHAIRVRSLRRLQALRTQNEERAEALEAALEAARRSEERYRDLLHSATELVQSVSPDGSILYVNRAWRETLGYEEHEVENLSIFDVIHPDSEARCRALFRRVTEQASSESVRATFVTKDGDEIIVEGSINCRFSDGVPVATRGIFRDVTERVKDEQALKRRNRDLVARNAVVRALAGSVELQDLVDEALSSTMEALDLGAGLIALVDKETRTLELYSHAGVPTSLIGSLETHGLEGTLCEVVYRRGESLGLDDLRSEARPDLPLSGLETLVRSGLQAYAGAPIVHGDRILGTLCLFDRHPRSLSEADHDLLTAIGQQIGVAVENARLFDQSTRRRLYLEGVLSAAPDAIITLDAHHRIVEWNAGAERLFGYTSQEVIGRDLDPLITNPEALEEATGFTRQVMGGDRVEPVEAVRYRKDGSPVDVLLAGSPILIEGEYAGAVAVYTDIGELKQAQQALRRYASKLESRNEELDAFAHTVAHDLKNPLQHLVGYTNLLRDDTEELPPDIRQEVLATIVDTADQMNNIIAELLLLAQVRSGDVATEPLDMASIVAAAQDRLAYLIEENDASVTTPPTWPTAMGHAGWIEEVWANYLSNAIKYGGDPPRVELGATEQPDGTVRFWVKDNGPGLTLEEQDSLFTPFTRLHQVQAEGHGLGLSIVQRIMDKLGGRVGVESTPGKGSTFFFTLPQA